MKSSGKPGSIPSKGLIENLDPDAVKLSQIRIQQNLLPAHEDDRLLDPLVGNQ